VFKLIAEAAAPSKATITRADTILTPEITITESIEKAISEATLVIADVTDSNPNVMYEVGIARAKNRPLIMIATSSRSIPFDIANVRVIIFDLANPDEFVSRLSSGIEEAFRSPNLFKAQSRERERKTTVFISYSHIDVEYLDRLLVHLKPLEKSGVLDLWVDTRLRAGDKWKVQIERALEKANVAILLVSADFLASDFITDNELPPLLKNAEERGTVVIPVILKPCRFTRDAQLRTFQAVNDPKRALILLPPGQQEVIYDQVAYEVERRLAKT
jgi:nucleoside 2-deoxyribosyltransferase